MKKIILVLLSIITLTAFTVRPVVFAEEQINISSDSAILVDYNSNTTLYSKNEKKHLTIASMTKIMLLDLIFNKYDEEAFKMEDEICVSENASAMGGSQVFLVANGKYKVGDLVKSIIVASANDASVAMAELLFGSESECVAKMNERAKELNMHDTVYANCTGLPKPMQYSCAKDVATVFKDLLSHKKYFDYSTIWMDEISHPDGTKTGLTNTNKLVKFYDGCDGGKTGYTSESGFCVSASAKRGNMRLISVVIKSPSSKERFADVSKMFNYGFNNYVNKCVISTEKPINVDYKVENGRAKSVTVYAEKDYYIFGHKGQKEKIDVDFEVDKKVKAPLKKGDKVGVLTIYSNGIEIGNVNCVVGQDVEEKGYFDYLQDVTRLWTV